MSAKRDSDSSTSDSEVSACSSSYNPLKVLYSKKSVPPVQNAPMYENINQFESALKRQDILPVGQNAMVKKREEEKAKKKQEEEKMLEEKNKQRFAQYATPTIPRRVKVSKNVLTRMQTMDGPLGVLRDCVDMRLRVKVITRNDRGVRGVLVATLVAFDRQWNLALSDVLETWQRKRVGKRKIPPGGGTPVPEGTAATISPVPEVTETPLGKGVWECTRHMPQIMVRGEHVVLINVTER